VILVTGGAGFIGANFVIDWLKGLAEPVVNLDRLTYSGNLANLRSLADDPRHQFVRGDICDRGLVRSIFADHRPRAVVHLAAESHVDRSIADPEAFIRTNVLGTFCLLEEARTFWQALPAEPKRDFRFLHVSTDEVYGSLDTTDPGFNERTPYAPNSPYSASKAGADHLVRAYHHTYGLPTLQTNCSNNYGRFQYPEKLIPLMILNACAGKPLPVYGDGGNVRDWLHVADHCSALRRVLERGRPGEVYNIGGNAERNNLELVRLICSILDELRPSAPLRLHAQLIRFVTDRPGHDHRYAIDASKIRRELDWTPAHALEDGIRATIQWYLENDAWVRSSLQQAGQPA
jgi:dTDP-glucose 4,6-dehydratase